METKHYITDVSFKALIVKEGKALFARETNQSTGVSKWELPGGRLHEGETIEQCIQREMQEELGIQVTIGELVYCFPNVSSSGKNHFIIIFRAEPVSGQMPKVNTPDIDEIRYIGKEEIEALPLWADYKVIFQDKYLNI
jgi:mutator protein MutT